MHPKIKPNHLQKIAYLYLRQSTPQQLIDNKESIPVQLQLKDKLSDMGFTNIEVIDSDLGKSADGYANRLGFTKMLNDVCHERVSAVAAWEASRLARSRFEWQNLIRFCQITGALVIDESGVYDPGNIDDNAMLGIKATMSEYELNMLTKRASAGLLEKAKRGELYMSLPMGYHLTDDDKYEMDPNERICQVIKLVFDKFDELGSARQTLLWFHQEKIEFPKSVCYRKKRTIIWELPIYATIIRILKNPAYAGAYVYGRRQRQVSIRDNQPVKSSKIVPMDEWKVLLSDHHQGYISWDRFLKNQQQLRENSNKVNPGSKGAPKMGNSLLSGLMHCGHCSRKATIKYSGRDGKTVSFMCRSAVRTTGQTKKCFTISGRKLENAVVRELLKTIQPAAIKAAIGAEEKLSAQSSERQENLELELKQAHYEADRRSRQFNAVEPENQLVIRRVQAMWNKAIAKVDRLEFELKSEQENQRPFDQTQREKLYDLANDLPRLWELPTTDNRTKKRIIRTLIERIIVKKEPDSDWTLFTICWAGGIHCEIRLKRNKSGDTGRKTSKEALEIVKELAAITQDRDIARVLNRCGLKTGAGLSWTKLRVKCIRNANDIPVFCKESYLKSGLMNLSEVAKKLKISPHTLLKIIKAGFIEAKQVVPYAPWVILRSELEKPQVIQLVRSVKKDGKTKFKMVENQLTL